MHYYWRPQAAILMSDADNSSPSSSLTTLLPEEDCSQDTSVLRGARVDAERDPQA